MVRFIGFRVLDGGSFAKLGFIFEPSKQTSNFLSPQFVTLKKIRFLCSQIQKRMGNIKIIRGVFDTELGLEHASVVAGFPSPADDYRHETLDFNRDYIRHPEASFYGDVEGDSMKDAGLLDGDRVIIDRAVEPHDGSIVVAWWEGGFTMKFLDEFRVWGVVIHLIRTFENL